MPVSSSLIYQLLCPKNAEEKIEEVIHEFKHGELKSGKDGNGSTVTSRKQAIAIAISEARHTKLKVPKEKSA